MKDNVEQGLKVIYTFDKDGLIDAYRTKMVQTQTLAFDEETGEMTSVPYILAYNETDVKPPDGLYKAIWNGKAWEESAVIEITPEIVEALRISKVEEISRACQNAIVAGIDVETSIGIEHFSLDDRDQKNITALSIAIAQEQMSIPGDINLEKGVLYHSDDNACRFFSANEFAALASGATKYVTYQTTYHNHLKVYVTRMADYEELKSVVYGMNLPEDLQSSLFPAVS